MHLSCKCASKFAPEGQLRLQMAPFLRTSRRDWVLVRVSRPRSTRQFSGLFLPQQGTATMFFSGAGRQPIFIIELLTGWVSHHSRPIGCPQMTWAGRWRTCPKVKAVRRISRSGSPLPRTGRSGGSWLTPFLNLNLLMPDGLEGTSRANDYNCIAQKDTHSPVRIVLEVKFSVAICHSRVSSYFGEY